MIHEAELQSIQAGYPDVFAELVRLTKERDALREALTKIRDICRRPDWTDTYTSAELNSDWREIWNMTRKALAANAEME